MMKVVLLGSPQTQWNIGKRFLPGGTIVEISDKESKDHKDVILEVVKEAKAEKVVEKKKGYGEEELFALNKAEQVEMLKDLGIEKIPRLEKDRVKAILEAQK